MPTYEFSASAGRLSVGQREEIVRSVTAIHHEETGAPAYFVQVIFYDLAPATHYIAGQAASPGQIWVRAQMRAGRTAEQKARIIMRILEDVSRISGSSKEDVWVYVSDIPALSVAEYGRLLPPPGGEDEWFAALPESLKQRLSSESDAVTASLGR